MKKIFFLILIVVSTIATAQNINFNTYFTDQTMRIDYYHIGDAKTELVTLDQVYKYGIWAGSTKNLIDNFNNGAYYFKIYDDASKKLIFSKGFDSYFKEYQTSEQAANGIKRTYSESALIPYPKNKIKFVLEKRERNNSLSEIYSVAIDPADLYIIKDPIKDASVKIYKSHVGGQPHNSLDVVILAEGYTLNQKAKFEKDLKRYTALFLSQEPFKKNKNKINIYGVFKASGDNSVDEPGGDVYKNTVLNANYYALGSERYILTEDNKAMRGLAAHVPYDAVYIMINNTRYGGGGIYNLYSTFISDNQFSDYIFLHEFGHSFGGLADEYYTSEVAYNEFYPEGQEPVEPNVTRLLDKNNLKWKDLATKGIQLPTPWEKEEYDKLDLAWQKNRREMNKNIAAMKRAKAPKKEIEAAQQEYDKKDKEHNIVIEKYIAACKGVGSVGAFEGAGYSSKGMYRSMHDCLMFSKGKKPFCKVCENHLEKVIKFYTE